MKRLALVFLVILFAFVSCSQPTYGILKYQERDIVAQCLVNDNFRCILEKKQSTLTLKILEPQALSSVSFVFEGDGVLAISGEVKIPLSKESLDGIYALLMVLCLREEELTSAKEEENGEATLCFLNGQGEYTLKIGKNQMPKSAEIISDGYHYKVIFESIMIE